MSSGRARSTSHAAGAARLAEAHAGEHGVDVDLGGRGLEGDVAGREPHVLVARLLLPAGLVAAVGLEQAPAEVVDRGAADVLVEVPLQVAGLEQPDVGAEALDGADAGEGGDQRLGHAGLDQVAGLGDVGEVRGPGVERHVEHLGAEQLGVLRLPRLDGGDAVLGAGRHVVAVVVEAAVAAHAALDERLGHRVVREQLGLGELTCAVVMAPPVPLCACAGLYTHRCTPASTAAWREVRHGRGPAAPAPAPGGAPRGDPARRGRRLRPHRASPPRRWRTSPTPAASPS